MRLLVWFTSYQPEKSIYIYYVALFANLFILVLILLIKTISYDLPFCEATDTPILGFWWRLPWVSKPGWITRFHAFLPAHNLFLRFTYGATPTDLLITSMVTDCIPYIYVVEDDWTQTRNPLDHCDRLSGFNQLRTIKSNRLLLAFNNLINIYLRNIMQYLV